MKLSVLLLLMVSFMAQAKVEELSYQVIEKQENFEVREYDSFIKATVTFENKDDYRSKGFRTLFKYISGDNTANREIDMTAPVIIEEAGTDIPMTAPVILNEDEKNSQYSMSFVMPASFTMQTLPLPNDKRIKIEFVEKSFKAAVRFSGYMWDYKVKKYTAKLLDWVKTTKFQAISKPVKAGYNAPQTLPFWRRNEILVDVDFK